MGAVFFGHASSVPSNRARAWLGDLMSSKCVLHVPCDAGPEESAACQRAGITHLPAVVAGGQVYVCTWDGKIYAFGLKKL
jgi:outer membrane protein assembly factor BamB